MKASLSPWIALFLLAAMALGWVAWAQDEEDQGEDFAKMNQRAEALEEEGNWAEALELRKRQLGDAGVGQEAELGKVLAYTLRDLGQLQEWPQADGLIDAALARHPQSLELLVAAAWGAWGALSKSAGCYVK